MAGEDLARVHNALTACRIVCFAAYFIMSLVIVVLLSMEKGCFVRHTYRPEFLAGLSSNPLYASTQIVRHPPSVWPDQQGGSLVWDPQRAADIGAFPVIISHPIRDAAFLPVKRDQDPSINSLFHALPRGGIQKMLDAIHDNDKEDLKEHGLVADDLAALQSILTIQADIFNLSDAPPWTPEHRVSRAYHLLNNGMVADPEDSMAMETSGLLTSMFTQGMRWSEGHGNGMLPNVLRCMKPFEHKESETPENRKKREYKWLSGLADYATYSQAKGACLLSGQQGLVDVSSNHKTSAAFFSSINVLYVALLVTWISASFSLFHVGSIIVGLEDYFVAIAWIWNLALIVTSLIPAWYNDYNIPLNNTMLGVILLGASIFIQAAWSVRSDVSNALGVTKGRYQPTPNSVTLFRGKMLRTDGMYIKQNYMDVLDKDEQADVLRCIEYAITDALLFTSVLIGVSPSVPTAIVQLCFVMALAYHVLCIPMIRMAYISETIEDPKWIFHSLWGTLIAGLSALILKVASMYAFLSYTAAHASTYQAGTQITGIAYVLAALDLTRSLVMITEAGLRAGKIWDEKNHRDINGVLHYTLSFVMRFTVVIMIVVASTNGGFSHSTCNMWD